MAAGIFVTYRGHLEGGKGGVQVCSQEYITIIKAAGVELRICALGADRRLSTRLMRRVNSSPYFRPVEAGAQNVIAGLVTAASPPDFIFLNQVSLAVLAPKIRRTVPPKCKIVVLSHGLESTDLLHLIRLRRQLPLSGRVRPTSAVALGNAILTEAALRTYVDLVVALSPSDIELEHWVGAKCGTWLPRLVARNALDWQPSGNRLGFVGTVDHAPNLEGLVAVLDQLLLRPNLGNLRIRIVGGPVSLGRWLQDKYPLVDYLGQIDDSELRQEAATWNAFLHPVFCLARGCSTKLATAISWQIPIITTQAGHRGYTWQSGSLALGETPELFASRCLEMLDTDRARTAQNDVAAVAASSPSINDIACRLRQFLGVGGPLAPGRGGHLH